MNEWDNEPDHERWTDAETGYECVIQRHTSIRHLCGYIGLPASHPWAKKSYDDVEMMNGDYVEVHGGLTYASEHEPTGKSDGLWWLGFDCAHSGDLSPGIDRYRGANDWETYKNWAYVKRETLTLARQAKQHADAVAGAVV